MLKKGVLEQHCKSLKHKKGKERLTSGERGGVTYPDVYKITIVEFICQVRLYLNLHVYTELKVVIALLRAGIPLNKVDCLREMLEKHAFSLSASTNLRQLIPFVLENEINQLKERISGKHVGIIFDGTTHVCEAFVVVLRYDSRLGYQAASVSNDASC